ncbi:MAG TPA: tyrosine-type recombinase/integrase [Leptolyngbyaceae cyanobacterium]
MTTVENTVENEDRWIWVNPKSKRLNLRFRVKGYKKQFFISTGLIDTEENRKKIRSLRDAIETDIFLEQFDPTLDRYQKFKKKKKKEAPKPLIISSLAELWERYSKYQSQHLEPSTMFNYERIRKIINKLPTDNLDRSPEIRDFLLENYSYHMAWQCIEAFSRCCEWGLISNLITTNTFKKLRLKKRKRTRNKIKAFTVEQRDLIISTFENHDKFSHFAPIIKFLFWTGCRPGEAIALTWEDVSPDCLHIEINKAYASKVKVLKGTKNGKVRTFSTNKGSKLNLLLLSIRPNNPDQKSFVFTDEAGKMLTFLALEKCWRGGKKGRYNYPGVVRELAEQGKVKFCRLYTTRHTFATLAIAANISPDKVAYWLGDDLATVLNYYCHPEVTKKSCPDF